MIRTLSCALSCLVAAFFSGCVSPSPEEPPAEPAPAPALTISKAEALEAVRADIRGDGRDPAGSELSAKAIDGYWHVTAWRIFYPENTGSSRFVPGGFTSYRVGSNGKIVSKLPGY